MPWPVFPRNGGINLVAEFRAWSAAAPMEAADGMAKLVAVGKYGMQLIGLFRDDTFAPPDLFLWQLHGWACFYVATEISGNGASVYVLHVNRIPAGSIAPLEREVQRRRGFLG